VGTLGGQRALGVGAGLRIGLHLVGGVRPDHGVEAGDEAGEERTGAQPRTAMGQVIEFIQARAGGGEIEQDGEVFEGEAQAVGNVGR
jgi:hypothetical protein